MKNKNALCIKFKLNNLKSNKSRTLNQRIVEKYRFETIDPINFTINGIISHLDHVQMVFETLRGKYLLLKNSCRFNKMYLKIKNNITLLTFIQNVTPRIGLFKSYLSMQIIPTY